MPEINRNFLNQLKELYNPNVHKEINENKPAVSPDCITTQEPQVQADHVSNVSCTSEVPPDGYKLNPLCIEKKTKRVQLLLRPSLYHSLKAKAKEDELSINEEVHRILTETLIK